jgi:alkylhydroperoxidase family enzyme
MRIKGLEIDETAPAVRRLYEKSIERLGSVPLPLTAMAHRPEVVETFTALTAALTRSKLVEPRLKTLVCVRAAQLAGCPF